MIGNTLGSYRVVGRLGEGGMGVVYSAVHSLIGRKAAVKLLLPEFSKNTAIVERFFNEARAATMIEHAGIVDIFDFGYTDDGSAYIIMEFLEGESLTARIARGTLSEHDALRLTRQVATALAAAHKAGIVHRDLKPDNIFVVPDSESASGERIKVLDFGIAKLSTDGQSTSKTRTGTMMGSPHYMSPEQCRGAGDVDARADVYSLGCVLFQMLCGRPPFEAEGVGELIGKHIYEQPVSPRSLVPSVSEATESLVSTALAKAPGDRFESMLAMKQAIDSITDGKFATAAPRQGYATPPAGMPVVSAPTDPTIAAGNTTLGSSAVSVTTPPQARPGWMMPAVAAAALVVGGAAFLATRGGSSDAQPAPTEVAAAAPTVSAPQTDRADEPPATPEAPAVKTVRLTIDARPHALVRNAAGTLLGETPYATDVEQGEDEHVFVLERDGYESERLALVPDRDHAPVVELRKHLPAERAPKAAAPKRAPASKTDSKPDSKVEKKDDPFDPFD